MTTMASSSSARCFLPLCGTPEEAAWIESLARAILWYISPITFALLYYVLPSPYGKLATPQWNKMLGPAMPARFAWFLFEVPNLLWAALAIYCFDRTQESASTRMCNYILLAFFVVHYIRRAILYPLQISTNASPTPFGVMLSAMVYTSINGYIQCQSLLQFQRFPADWHRHPAFVGGLLLATSGMLLNRHADAVLRRLKSQTTGPTNKRYVIPHGSIWFDLVSCPHYLGEVLEWIGFAVACHTVVAASFAAFTMANLIPRATQQHAWYRQHFGQAYPAQRKAWLPFLW